MEKRSGKEWSGMILVMGSMVLMLMVTVAVSPPAGDRAVQTLGQVIERLSEPPGRRTSEEIRERWRVTRPGMLFSKDFISKSDPPALRAEENTKRVEVSDFHGQNVETAPFAEERLTYRPTRTGGMPTIENPKGVPYSEKGSLYARE